LALTSESRIERSGCAASTFLQGPTVAIQSLTDEQQQLLTERIAYWVQLGHCTAPLDRSAAAEAIGSVYEALGLARPAVLFFSSPLMCLLAAGVLEARVKSDPDTGRTRWGELRRLLRSSGGLRKLLRRQLAEQGCCSYPSRESPWRLYAHVPGLAAAGILSKYGIGEIDKFRSRFNVAIRDYLAKDLYRLIWDSCLDGLTGLEDEISDQLWRGLETRLAGGWLSDEPLNHMGGSWMSIKSAVFDYCARIGVKYPPEEQEVLAAWIRQTERCHWWFPYDEIALASDRPRILSVDEGGRLHNECGSALEYRDGFGLHAWHGVLVGSRVITAPESIAPRDIEAEPNAEVRRVMLERYGWQRYIRDCGATVVDEVPEDHHIVGLRGARLLRKELAGEPEPVVYLEMVNATPERDGTVRRYLERIDPGAYGGDAGRSCHAAMASRWWSLNDSGELVRTFDRWQDYLPTAES
jgi:hypothetical protein